MGIIMLQAKALVATAIVSSFVLGSLLGFAMIITRAARQ